MSLTDKSKSNSSVSVNKLVKVKITPNPHESRKRKRNASVMEEDEHLRLKKARKQARSQPESEEEYSGGESDDDPRSKKESSSGVTKTRGIYRDTSKTKKDEPGAQFKAKKATGDMKKRGAPEPYAYLPMDRKNLKKRGGMKDQFKGIIGAARKGALIGQKLRHQRNKKK